MKSWKGRIEGRLERIRKSRQGGCEALGVGCSNVHWKEQPHHHLNLQGGDQAITVLGHKYSKSFNSNPSYIVLVVSIQYQPFLVIFNHPGIYKTCSHFLSLSFFLPVRHLLCLYKGDHLQACSVFTQPSPC